MARLSFRLSFPKLLARAALWLGVAACGGEAGSHAVAPAGTSEDRPAVASIVREGDPRAALAVAVWTYGIAPERGAQPAVALAALTQARLVTRWPDVTVVPSWEGYRVRGLLDAAPETATAVRAALLAPVQAQELAAVHKKVQALANKPLRDPALADVMRCRGEPFGVLPAPALPTLAEVEAWRREAHGFGRVALSVVGPAQPAKAVADAVHGAPAWPRAVALPAFGWGASPALLDPVVYDARNEAPRERLRGAREARVTLAFRTTDAERTAAIAPALADPHGPLMERLDAVEGDTSLEELTVAVHAQGACLVLSLDFRELGANPAARMATAIALVRQETLAELAKAGQVPSGLELARRAGDPRDAAERGAWWALYSSVSKGSPAAPDDERTPMLAAVGLAGKETSSLTGAAVRDEIERSIAAWRAPVVASKVGVERGQSELWMVVGSPCGTLAEAPSDAGLGAAFAMLAAEQARARIGGGTVEIEPFAAVDAIGLIAHGAALPGETPVAQAQRLADAVARGFVEPPDLGLATHVRAALLSGPGDVPSRALVALAGALVPGHPSWFSPTGNLDVLARSSDGALLTRAAALRGGPLRVAVLAGDPAQGAAAAAAVDRWIPRRAGEARACPAPSEPSPPRPGTYTVDTSGAPDQIGQAWLAIPLPRGDEHAVQLARFFGYALDGDDGLLAKALGGPGLARAWSARVVGPPRGAALIVRITSTEGALDAAVSQTRALLDRLRQRGLDAPDRQRAIAAQARDAERALLEPRGRLLALFRDARAANDAPPTLDALRSFAQTALRDDALVIAAARAPRPPRATQ